MSYEHKLTKLTDMVMLGGRPTSIMAEHQRNAGVFDPTPTVRGYAGASMARSHSDKCRVTIWNDARDVATFAISSADCDFLRGHVLSTAASPTTLIEGPNHGTRL